MASPFIQELQYRGMLDAIVPGTAAQLAKEPTAAYIGFDPTASSLHVGHLATIMLLKHLQLAGHHPIIVLGGATGMIGDPSFKAAERTFLDRETLLYNQQCIAAQMSRFLDFSGPNRAIVMNNYDWFKDMGFLQFLREVGKHISVNYMITKDAVKTRLKTGLSYTEFAYQLLQAYDFYYLYTQHGVKMQMGGADQWGNITTGIALIKKKAMGIGYGLTTPLITKADGTKFGKTEAGNIWLDKKRTSAYAFYQFWLNCSDEEAKALIKCMTLYSKETIEALIATHTQAPHERTLQKALAKATTTLVHSEATYRQAAHTSDILFGHASYEALAALDEHVLLESLTGIPQITLEEQALDKVPSLAELLSYTTHTTIFNSKRAAREVIAAGGIRLNKIQYTEPDALPTLHWLYSKYLLVQKGKKHFYLIKRQQKT